MPALPTPKGWEEWHTGGGCWAWRRDVPSERQTDSYTITLEWLITDEDAQIPQNPDDPCMLGLYDIRTGEGMVYWKCANLAEAMKIAEGGLRM